MTRTLTGSTYNKTLGQTLDYYSLARFLLEEVEIHKWWSHFWDCPCGTGTLLSCLNKMHPQLKSFGLDNSEKQLKEALRKLNKQRIVNEDIFKFSTVSKAANLSNGFCHIGFCFFNTLSCKKRLLLLREILARKSISSFGFEIQNSEHQKKNYKPGKWYTTNLPGGIVLVSKSEQVSKEAKVLVMKFQGPGQEYVIQSKMYDWPIQKCIEDCMTVGVKNIKIFIPPYRKLQKKSNSHWFVIARCD